VIHFLVFTGQTRDAETQLDFINARYMSASQGRFLSPDPFNAGADAADPQTRNGYGQVEDLGQTLNGLERKSGN
jgi:RHS repeat-associated protein